VLLCENSFFPIPHNSKIREVSNVYWTLLALGGCKTLNALPALLGALTGLMTLDLSGAHHGDSVCCSVLFCFAVCCIALQCEVIRAKVLSSRNFKHYIQVQCLGCSVV